MLKKGVAITVILIVALIIVASIANGLIAYFNGRDPWSEAILTGGFTTVAVVGYVAVWRWTRSKGG